MSSQIVNSVFDCSDISNNRNKIWEKFSNSIFENDAIIFQQNCSRISQSHGTPKPITLYLGEQTLYYFKQKAPAGMLPLNFVTMGTKTYDGQLIICLSRNQKIVGLMIDDPDNFLKLLSTRCILTTFHEDYHVEKKIGIGNQATIFQAIKKQTNQRFAIKAYNKQQIIGQARERLKNEIKMMRSLNHEILLHLYEVHETQNTIYLVMDLLTGGDLSSRMLKTTYSDNKLQQIMYNFLKGLHHMHSKGFMHRDIKPQNILLKSKESDVDIVLADFGLGMLIHEPPIFKRCGTPGFVAPEVLHYERFQDFYDEKCDIFSAGAILYMLITGNSPFKGIDQATTLELNLQCRINFEVKQICKAPKPLQSLLKKMLRVNPKTRYSAEKCLNHEYFKGMQQENDFQAQQKEPSIVQIVQQVNENDENNENFDLITQEKQWNGKVDTLESHSNQSPREQQKPQIKGSLSKFGQFCIAMEGLNQTQTPKKKNDESLYKMALINATNKEIQDDSGVQEKAKEIEKSNNQSKNRFLKKSNSLNV